MMARHMSPYHIHTYIQYVSYLEEVVRVKSLEVLFYCLGNYFLLEPDHSSVKLQPCKYSIKGNFLLVQIFVYLVKVPTEIFISLLCALALLAYKIKF